MATAEIASPFISHQRDWGFLFYGLFALVFTTAIHSLGHWLPTPPPLQHQGQNDWRVISSVHLVQASETPSPAPEETAKPAAKPVEPPKPKAEKPKPKSESKPVEKSQPKAVTEEVIKEDKLVVKETVQQAPPEPEKPNETTEIAEEITPAKAEDTSQAALTDLPISQQQTTQRINNLTASLVTQPAGIPLAEYRSQIIERINANKHYPRTARRRGIQGDVKVSFTITHEGMVIDLFCLGDSKLLNSSACEAIKKSLPFPVPQQPTLQLSFVMDYVLQ